MAHQYRYHRPTEHLEYYLSVEYQGSPPPPDVQPPRAQDLVPVGMNEPLTFVDGEADLRDFQVNTPTGNPLGTVTGFLVDAMNDVIPFAYVRFANGETVVVPTNQFTIFAAHHLVTLEGGIEVLRGAPRAAFDYTDAAQGKPVLDRLSTARRRVAYPGG